MRAVHQQREDAVQVFQGSGGEAIADFGEFDGHREETGVGEGSVGPDRPRAEEVPAAVGRAEVEGEDPEDAVRAGEDVGPAEGAAAGRVQEGGAGGRAQAAERQRGGIPAQTAEDDRDHPIIGEHQPLQGRVPAGQGDSARAGGHLQERSQVHHQAAAHPQDGGAHPQPVLPHLRRG